ncbi:MAG: glycosyltransferase family 4 protein [Desulfobacterales bacterium]
MVARPITVVQMLPGLEGGGVERGTLETGAYLTERGHRSIVISGGGRLVGPLERQGSRHLKWRVGEKTPVCLMYLPALRRLLLRENVDILHLRSRLPAWVGYLAWRSLPPNRRPKLVTTFHGFYSVNAYSAIMTRGERVIAISEIIRTHIRERYDIPDDRIVVIHRGMDHSYFDPERITDDRLASLRSRWGLSDTDAQRPLIMLPGRITRLKGHDVFINSLARIRHLDWHGICVGDTDENPGYVAELTALISRVGLEKRITFARYCDDMPAALMLADIAVSATSGTPEAFGRIAIEAQAMGTPVVASAHGGSLETLLNGKTGWLVEPGDAQAMADALAGAISDAPMREAFGRQGREWVRERFTVEKMCGETLDLYQQLLQGFQ